MDFLTTDFHGFSRIFAMLHLGGFLTTDFTDFTDFLLRIGGGERVGWADAIRVISGSLKIYFDPR